MVDGEGVHSRARWGRLRFMVISSLLAQPPEAGELQGRIALLSQQQWQHPTKDEKVSVSFPTIQRWYYAAKGDVADPVQALTRRRRKDAGKSAAISEQQADALAKLYRDHPCWQYKLHYDNLLAMAERNDNLGKVPSYVTVHRYMKSHGMMRQKSRRKDRAHDKEMRGWEVRYSNQLWHLDFHEASRSVLLADGTWKRPVLLGILDDHSRLACHLQWYLTEDTENLVHGLCQALQKRGLPRALMTDNGSAMKAAETQQGLKRLGILHCLTLPKTPEQNGKQEHFWTQIDSRLLPMLEGVPNLTLKLLNEATQAWVEGEYNQRRHSETEQTPYERFVGKETISRTCPDAEVLRQAFRVQETRRQRSSDNTISIEGRRFQLPSRFRCLQRVTARFCRWDLSSAALVDPNTEQELCTIYPVDYQQNAEQARRELQPTGDPLTPITESNPRESGVAPLLQHLMADYAATGIPFAYLPKDDLSTTAEPS